MISARCRCCNAELPAESLSEPETPCPVCGSTGRAISVELRDGVGVTDRLSHLETESGRTSGFGESPRDGVATSARSSNDGQVEEQIAGRSPQGEQDTLHACTLLMAKLNREGGVWARPEPGVDDVDCKSVSQDAPSEHLLIQVVRADVDQSFWHNLSKKGRMQNTILVSQAADILRKAIDKKAKKIPSDRRRQLLLALDATRLPGRSLYGVVADFRERHVTWAQRLGFQQIWLVGPVVELVSRLDAMPPQV